MDQYNQYIYRNGEWLLIGDGTGSDFDIKWEAGKDYSQGDIVSYNNNWYVANRNITGSQSFGTVGNIDIIHGYQVGDVFPSNQTILVCNDFIANNFSTFEDSEDYFDNLTSDTIDTAGENFLAYYFTKIEWNQDHTALIDPWDSGDTSDILYVKEKVLLKLNSGFQISIIIMKGSYEDNGETISLIDHWIIPTSNNVVPTTIQTWGDSSPENNMHYIHTYVDSTGNGGYNEQSFKAYCQYGTTLDGGNVIICDNIFTDYFLLDTTISYENNNTNKDWILLDFPTQNYLTGSFENTDELYNQKNIINNNLNSHENGNLMPGSIIFNTEDNKPVYNILIDIVACIDNSKIGENSSNSEGYHYIDPEEQE